MASVHKITRGLKENNVDEKLSAEIIGEGDIINIIRRMDDMLDKEVTYKVLDACACCTKTSKAQDKKCKEYGKAMEGKPLSEKVKGLGSIDFHNVTLNDDGTLYVNWYWDIVEGTKTCSCGAINVPIIASKMLLKDKKVPVDERVMPLSYCYCCTGHFRYHLQNALRLKLKTKEILSSPINSKGEDPCAFVFEIL